MSTYVLVHGAWHGGWCWERVAAPLRARGHAVLTPTLTGLGERAAELGPQVGLHTHVEDVLELLRDADEPAILVGHSYAGLVVREAADREPRLVVRLVPVEGWIGPNGVSMFSLAPSWFVDDMTRAAAERGDGWRIPPLAPALVGISDPADAAWLEARLTPHPLRSFTEATTLSGAVDAVAATAIVAAPQGPLPFAEWAFELGYETVAIEGGHDLMVTSPEALVASLLDLA